MTTKDGRDSVSTTAYRNRCDRLRLDGPGPQPRLPARAELLPRSRLRAGAGGGQRHRRGPTRRCRAIVRIPNAQSPTGTSVVDARRRRRRLRHRSEHAARRDGRGGGGQRQARVLREAGRRHAGADGRRRTGGTPGRRDHRCRLQLPVGAARAVRQAARSTTATIGDITNYYGRFFSMYGSDPLGSAVVAVPRRRGRPRRSAPTSSATRSISPTTCRGDRSSVVGTGETFIKQRPLPTGAGTHYDRGKPGDPTGEVTNEDYIGMMCVFESGARGTFEACRSMVGPESQNSFEVYGTQGFDRAGTSRQMNELRVYIAGRAQAHRLHDRVRRRSLPAPRQLRARQSANGIGFEDLICIEDHEFLAVGRRRSPAHARASPRRWRYVTVQDAVLRSLGARTLGRRRLTEGGMSMSTTRLTTAAGASSAT